MRKILILVTLFVSTFLGSQVLQAEQLFELKSPNGTLVTTIVVGETIEYSVSHNGELLLAKSPISMQIAEGEPFGVGSRLRGSSERSVEQEIEPLFYRKNLIKDCFNELELKFAEKFSLIFRAYDDGVAYRFLSDRRGELIVEQEEAKFNFPSNSKAYVPYVEKKRGSLEEQMFTSFENTYQHIHLLEWDKERLAFLPLLVEGEGGKKLLITEADLINYPGMFLYNKSGDTSLEGVFAPYPAEEVLGGHNMLQQLVVEREPYVAKYEEGRVSFPWRVIVVAEHDAELLDNDMVYRLATPRAVDSDFLWVKPGKVAWDWWNAWNIEGVDFYSGVNNDTYKYYIDFASEYDIEYVILDEGWAVNRECDLFQVVPEIELEELIEYASQRDVGLILWAGYYAFHKDMERVCKHYSEMGIKGFKIDFMDRDDQPMVDFHYKAAEMAARYELLLNFHGTYKPTGLHRTFPNVINYEGVHGLEQMKWSEPEVDQVTYDVTFPFIRMLAGAVDYTQGAMRNASQENYFPVNSEAMSQGTRCRQLAEYVIFESPLNMMCDSPSNYMREEESTQFIAKVPTVWDETVVLSGKIGEHIAIARRSGEVWYLGALTNWSDRELELDLSFLGEGSYSAEIFRDGKNAHRIGRDYKREEIELTTKAPYKIYMAPAGGYVMKIDKN